MEKYENMNRKEIDSCQLKNIQLEIMDAIDTFCVNNGINYSLACGSLLGAVRHKGFIPWDDDIDIYLMRDDYKKLIQIFPDVFLGKYKLISLERNKEYNKAYAKVYDDSTILMEFANSKPIIGVNIDIFPLDFVPEDKKIYSRYNKIRKFIISLYQVKMIRISSHRPFYKNIILLVGKLFLLLFSSRRLAIYISNYAQVHNSTPSKYVFETVQGLLQKNRKFTKSFKSYIRIPFEDRNYQVVKDYDIVLTQGYGDYMKLPPIEKRVSHHSFKAYKK